MAENAEGGSAPDLKAPTDGTTVPPSVTQAVILETKAKTPTPEAFVEVRSGRRRSDWHIVTSNGRSIFFWLFGMFLDEKHKPSMSRCMLALWTWIGWLMIKHELILHTGQVPLGNAVWQSWWAAEGFLALAVFGPSVASYFGAGAAGAVTGIAQSIRDDLGKVNEALTKRKEKDA
jgi:hypothetical protein